ncbi:hypothetical protein IC575_002550 [Cucumis melo]
MDLYRPFQSTLLYFEGPPPCFLFYKLILHFNLGCKMIQQEHLHNESRTFQVLK